jgi:alkyldihydroxyacetonephosphate synthase
MKRWNGWGDPAIDYHLADSAISFIENKLGKLNFIADVSLDDVLASVPTSKLVHHPLISTASEDRLRHARGQSLPDWVALRSGRIPAYPDGVASPCNSEDVQALLGYARQVGAALIPYGGGTSVVGHINPIPGDKPVITVNLRGLNQLRKLDEISHLATFEAGIRGPEIEANLAEHGYTLGHFPQSFEYSTLGGWIATRSCGQQSLHYGRIENLFAGGQIESPRGALDIPLHPASAAGPDLRQIILGSEGRLGIITHATVRVRPLPESEGFYGVFFHHWEEGVAAVRTIQQSGLQASMLRLSDPDETEANLVLSGKERLTHYARQGLSLLGYGPERCLLIYAVTGSHKSTRQNRRGIEAVCRAHGGLPTGATIGRIWEKSRFRTPYLRNTLWEKGIAIDTLETALPWAQIIPAAAAIKKSIYAASAESEGNVFVFAHLSHLYRDGASIYVTYLFRREEDPDKLLARWQKMKGAASGTIVAFSGTISHQHGVGVDHAAYLEAEKGQLGIEAIEAACQTFDPQGLLNPGKLIIPMKQ